MATPRAPAAKVDWSCPTPPHAPSRSYARFRMPEVQSMAEASKHAPRDGAACPGEGPVLVRPGELPEWLFSLWRSARERHVDRSSGAADLFAPRSVSDNGEGGIRTMVHATRLRAVSLFAIACAACSSSAASNPGA